LNQCNNWIVAKLYPFSRERVRFCSYYHPTDREQSQLRSIRVETDHNVWPCPNDTSVMCRIKVLLAPFRLHYITSDVHWCIEMAPFEEPDVDDGWNNSHIQIDRWLWSFVGGNLKADYWAPWRLHWSLAWQPQKHVTTAAELILLMASQHKRPRVYENPEVSNTPGFTCIVCTQLSRFISQTSFFSSPLSRIFVLWKYIYLFINIGTNYTIQPEQDAIQSEIESVIVSIIRHCR